jgi:SAM-dependent methyltransferase
MGSIADSSAVFTKKMLPQHHTAITLLGQLLATPGVHHIAWLDLACGKGQILAQLDENISEPELRARISYFGYDIDNENSRVAERIATGLKFHAVEVKTGEMADFAKLFPLERKFSFVSFTNTVHELRPQFIASLILDIILRLDAKGVLYIYDMEMLPLPELGAVPWNGDDLKKVLEAMFEELGCGKPTLLVQRWNHSSCSGWSVNLHRSHLQVEDQLIISKAEAVVTKAAATIAEVLTYKLKTVSEALEAITCYGSDNAEESKEKTKLLYDFWSLERAIQQSK